MGHPPPSADCDTPRARGRRETVLRLPSCREDARDRDRRRGMKPHGLGRRVLARDRVPARRAHIDRFRVAALRRYGLPSEVRLLEGSMSRSGRISRAPLVRGAGDTADARVAPLATRITSPSRPPNRSAGPSMLIPALFRLRGWRVLSCLRGQHSRNVRTPRRRGLRRTSEGPLRHELHEVEQAIRRSHGFCEASGRRCVWRR